MSGGGKCPRLQNVRGELSATSNEGANVRGAHVHGGGRGQLSGEASAQEEVGICRYSDSPLTIRKD